MSPKPPPWVRDPDKWMCPKCGSHNLSAPEAVIWTCVDCGCRKSWEAFARSAAAAVSYGDGIRAFVDEL